MKNKVKQTISLYGKFIFLEIFLLVLFIFLSISVVFNANFIISTDNFIFNLVDFIRSTFTNNLFLFITFFGETLFIFLGLIVALVCLKKKSIPLIVCLGSSAGISFILKNLIKRARPVGQFVNNLIINYTFPSSFSFPSGHSQNSLVFYMILTFIILNNYKGKHKKLIITLSSIFVSLIMLSRLILGVHFFTDILGGILLGLIIIVAYKFYVKIKQQKVI